MTNIIITGGGTLGHINPAIGIIEELLLNYPNIKIYYVGNKDSLEEKEIKKIDKVDFIQEDLKGFNKSIIHNLKSLIKFYKSTINMKKFIKSNNIKLVIGTGGYVSSSSLYAAYKLKITTVIHEQNRVLGITNKFLQKKVDLFITSFEDTIIKDKNNVICLGNPRMDIANKYKEEVINNKKLILILGGSLGAQKINELAIKLVELNKNNKNIEYMLISGKRYFKNYERYNFIYNNLKVIESTDKILEYMNKCDLIISRAGATTISEIISLEKPSILIPSPNVSNNHQEYNADGLYNKNACIKINEENINIEEINKEINNILYDNNVINNIKEELRKLNKSNVCKKIVSESINKLNE